MKSLFMHRKVQVCLKAFQWQLIFKRFKKVDKADIMVKVLNVAEKNDAAKSIAEVMSRGSFNRVKTDIIIQF